MPFSFCRIEFFCFFVFLMSLSIQCLKVCALVFLSWVVRSLEESRGVELSPSWMFPFLYLSMPPSLHLCRPPSFTSIPLHPSMQPYYHSGSFPEFLLSLLSNWRPPAKKRPAVSYGHSGLDRASRVCASSFLLCALPSVVSSCAWLHIPSVMLWPQHPSVFWVRGHEVEIYGQYCCRIILICSLTWLKTGVFIFNYWDFG